MNSAQIFRDSVRRTLDENRARGAAPGNQKELAAKLKMSPTQLSNILNQATSPNLDTVDRFAAALSTSASALIAGSERSPGRIRDALRLVRELHAALESGDLDSPIVAELFSEMKKRT